MSIPTDSLLCHICGDQHFSDVSHLLTHLASKGHLAADFRARHAAGKPDRAQAVQKFDEWTERWGIDALIAARLAAKEIKKAKEHSARTRKPRVDVCIPFPSPLRLWILIHN